jgi:hypothetical protein
MRLAGKTTARAARGAEAAATSEDAGTDGGEDDDYVTYQPHTRENPSAQPIRVPKPLDHSKVRAADQDFTHKVEGTGKIFGGCESAPATKVSASGGGIFKKTQIEKRSAMQPAKGGEETPEE